MHPWHGVLFLGRKRRHQEFKKWLADNPQLRIPHGTVKDGKVFCGYSAGYANGEHWTTPDAFARRLEHARNKMREFRKDPAFKEAFNCYIKFRYGNKEARYAKARINNKKHRQEKPWMIAANQRRRYAIKKSRFHPELDKSKERAIFLEAARLTRETGIEHHVDHIIPLMRGGWHHHDNLQVLPIGLNLAKGTDPFWHHPGYKSWRDVPESLWPDQLRADYRALFLRSA